MTNEELAAAVQAGEREPMDLWVQVWRFTRRQALRWEAAYGVRGGATAEDFMQAGYLAILDALGRWEPGQCFLTFYGIALKSAFLETCGGRSTKQQADPLRCSPLSLDAPADPNSEDSSDLGELIQDPAATEALETVTERDRAERLHTALEAALQALTEPQRAVVVSKYYLGQDADRKALAAAMRALRAPAVSRPLRVFV